MRSGVVAEKIGMSRQVLESGESIPVTLVKVHECIVIGHKTISENGYCAVQLAYGVGKPKKTSKPMLGFYSRLNIEPALGVKEFRVQEEGLLPVGEKIGASHFEIGSFLDVVGISIGKGFAGGMKRHNFGGLRATHGVSVSHRSHGSTGNRQDPGKVFKGKKMAGHMGCVQVTQQNLKVVYVDGEKNILAIKGAVPGAVGSTLYLKDAVKVKK